MIGAQISFKNCLQNNLQIPRLVENAQNQKILMLRTCQVLLSWQRTRMDEVAVCVCGGGGVALDAETFFVRINN